MLVAQIDVELERETTSRRTVCTTVNQTTQCRIATQRTTKTFSDTVVVQDSITVTVDAPVLSGLVTTYPNGDRGFANTIDSPWSAYSVPGGTVRGVWQFYSARDPTWDTLTVATSTGEAQRASPLVPLHVHAYPSRQAPVTGSPLTVDVLETDGHVTPVPTLPEVIALDTPAESYLANATFAARFSGLDDGSTVAVSGLVRGVERDASLSAFPERAMRPVSLRLTVQETTSETVTLELALHETDTGLPVSTASMDGTLSLDGVRLNTSSDGTVIRTVPRDTGIHTARFVPHSWWNLDATYAPASDTVYVREIPINGIDALYRLGVYAMVFGVAAFLIGRTTGWRIWPPWRGL
ncbi:hypothetical protein [Halarchaeum grantii]|nr:hypothetical protein [Halarchaeum grantii]